MHFQAETVEKKKQRAENNKLSDDRDTLKTLIVIDSHADVNYCVFI